MMFGNPAEDYEVNPVIAKAMDRFSRSTPITSKTLPPPPCASPAPPGQPFAALPQASRLSGVPPTAVPTKPS